MNDQQPQYFEVGMDAPASMPKPWWKTWKLAIAVGGLFILVAVIVFAYNTVQLGREGQERANALSAMEQAIAACESARDPVQCADRVRNAAAQEGAGAAACDGISTDGFASCVSLAAREEGDVAACADLSQEERLKCEDLAWLTAATTKVNIKTCDNIGNSGMATNCRLRVTASATASGECEEAGVDVALCEEYERLREAIAVGTEAACHALATEEMQIDCLESIASQDNDNDGLVLQDEVKAGTSDEDADSDNDGYSDGTEVKNGFNPKD